MRKTLFVLGSMLTLVACAKENDSIYLIQHPAQLRQVVAECQSQPANARCQRIMMIADRYNDAVNKAIQNPMELGQYVLDTQSACVAARLEWQQAQMTLTASKTKQDPVATITEAEKNVSLKKEAYEDKREEVQILYAVIGQNSPE